LVIGKINENNINLQFIKYGITKVNGKVEKRLGVESPYYKGGFTFDGKSSIRQC
jgi:hypothetical protein